MAYPVTFHVQIKEDVASQNVAATLRHYVSRREVIQSLDQSGIVHYARLLMIPYNRIASGLEGVFAIQVIIVYDGELDTLLRLLLETPALKELFVSISTIARVIMMKEVGGALVEENDIAAQYHWTGYGLIADDNQSILNNRVTFNTFEYPHAAVQTQGDNIIDIACNDFVGSTMGMSVNPQSSGGSLSPQGVGCGTGDYRPTNDFNILCTSPSPKHINSSIDFVYYEDPDNASPAIAACVDMPSGWAPCGFDFQPTTCALSLSGSSTHERAGQLIESLGEESDQQMRGKILSELMRVLLDLDTTWSTIADVLVEADLDEADRILAAAYYTWGLPDSSLVILEGLSLSSPSDTLFYNTYYLLDTALLDSLTILDFGQSEAGQILEWMELNYEPAFISQNIARAVGWAEGYDAIELWPQAKRGNEDEGEDESHSAVTAYPVPFSSEVAVAFSMPAPHGTKLRVTDITGREVMQVVVPEGASQVVLTTSHFANGLYVGRVLSDDQLMGTVKLVKQ